MLGTEGRDQTNQYVANRAQYFLESALAIQMHTASAEEMTKIIASDRIGNFGADLGDFQVSSASEPHSGFR